MFEPSFNTDDCRTHNPIGVIYYSPKFRAHHNLYTLTLCTSRTPLTIFLFGIRGFATSFFQVIYLYTPEVGEVFNMETC